MIGRLSHYLQGFIHPRWLFGISSINSNKGPILERCDVILSFCWTQGWPQHERPHTRQTAQAKEKAMPRVPWRKGDLIGFFRKKTRIPINQRGFHRMSLVGLYIWQVVSFFLCSPLPEKLPLLGVNDPIWRAYFSTVLKPLARSLTTIIPYYSLVKAFKGWSKFLCRFSCAKYGPTAVTWCKFFPGSQPPFQKCWFFLEDDEPLLKSWWFGN